MMAHHLICNLGRERQRQSEQRANRLGIKVFRRPPLPRTAPIRVARCLEQTEWEDIPETRTELDNVGCDSVDCDGCDECT